MHKANKRWQWWWRTCSAPKMHNWIEQREGQCKNKRGGKKEKRNEMDSFLHLTQGATNHTQKQCSIEKKITGRNKVPLRGQWELERESRRNTKSLI